MQLFTFYLGQSLLWPARCALQRLQQENKALKESRGRAGAVRLGGNKQPSLRSQTWEEEEEEEGEEEEDVEKEEGTSPQNAPAGKRGPPSVNLSKERGKRQCTRPLTARHSQPVTCHTEFTHYLQILGKMLLLIMYETQSKYFKALNAFFFPVSVYLTGSV